MQQRIMPKTMGLEGGLIGEQGKNKMVNGEKSLIYASEKKLLPALFISLSISRECVLSLDYTYGIAIYEL
jgi:hypothetical protein